MSRLSLIESLELLVEKKEGPFSYLDVFGGLDIAVNLHLAIKLFCRTVTLNSDPVLWH